MLSPRQSCEITSVGGHPLRIAAISCAAFILFAPLLYVGRYLAPVSPGRHRLSLCYGSRVTLDEYDYRFGGAYTAHFFAPLERLDHRLRPEFRKWANVASRR